MYFQKKKKKKQEDIDENNINHTVTRNSVVRFIPCSSIPLVTTLQRGQ